MVRSQSAHGNPVHYTLRSALDYGNRCCWKVFAILNYFSELRGLELIHAMHITS